MLHATVAEKSKRPVWFVHGTQNGKEHALRDELEQAISQHSSAEQHIFYSRPLETDKKGRDYNEDGRITVQALINLDAGTNAQYMLCGPARFMSEIRQVGWKLLVCRLTTSIWKRSVRLLKAVILSLHQPGTFQFFSDWNMLRGIPRRQAELAIEPIGLFPCFLGLLNAFF